MSNTKEEDSLANKVADLQKNNDEAMVLLGQIIGCLSWPKNREDLGAFETGRKFLEIADGWCKRYEYLIQE